MPGYAVSHPGSTVSLEEMQAKREGLAAHCAGTVLHVVRSDRQTEAATGSFLCRARYTRCLRRRPGIAALPAHPSPLPYHSASTSPPTRTAPPAPESSPHPLLARVDWEAAGREAADLLSAYVRSDTSRPRGRTIETADFLEEILQSAGLETRRYPTPEPDKVNLASW